MAKEDKGYLLENRIKRLIFHMGYFPKVGVKIKTSNESISDLVTDLDVTGYLFNKDFHLTKLWVDCKSGKAKPQQHTVWLIGMKQILSFNNVWFMKNNVKLDTRDFARNNGIQVIDNYFLNRMEKYYEIKENDYRGSWNPDNYNGFLTRLNRMSIPSGDNFKRVVNFISYDYWASESYKKLKKCFSAFKLLNQIDLSQIDSSNHKVIRWANYELTTLFTLALLEVANDLYFLSIEHRNNLIEDMLISSDLSQKQRYNVLNASYRLANEIVKSKYPEHSWDNDIPKSSFNILHTAPIYIDQLKDLLNRIIEHPNMYYDILRAIDYSLFEFEFNDKKVNEDEVNKLIPNFSNNRYGIKTIINFICQTNNLNRDLFKNILQI